MARLLGNPFGEIRGKLGGSVFSRNKGGQIMRVYAKPVNVNSVAQRVQRTNFRAMSGAWSAITDVQRQSWNEFAKSVFNPLMKTNTGQFSGVSAFKANKTAIFGMASRILDFAICTDMSSTPLTHLGSVAQFTGNPPSASVRPNFFNVAGNPCIFTLGDVSIGSDGTTDFSLFLLGLPPAGLSNGDLKDENGIKYSVALYLSNNVKSIGSKPNSPLQFCMGQTGIVTFSAGTLAGANKATFHWDASTLVSNFIGFPGSGSVCLVSIILIGENGTQTLACQDYTTIA